jgi:hypothetical protein
MLLRNTIILLALLVSIRPGISAEIKTLQWEPVDIVLRAERNYPWWEFPVETVFTHAGSADQLRILGFASGARRFTVRFAPTRPGRWTYDTKSADPGLDGRAGEIVVSKPRPADI